MRILTESDFQLLRAAPDSALAFARDDLQAIEVTGADRIKYLQAMLTQDVTGLAENGVGPACLCDAQGKILAILTVVKEAERVWLWTATSNAEFLRNHLDRYVIMADAELTLRPDLALVSVVGAQSLLPDTPAETVAATQIAGADVHTWLLPPAAPLPGEPALPERWIVVARDQQPQILAALLEAGVTLANDAVHDALRLLNGVPKLGRDIEDGSLPIEVGLRDTVSYRKGCYVGQEAIAMMTYRGQLRRHLCWVQIEAGQPQPGWQLRTEDGKRAGKMGSAVQMSPERVLGLATIARKVYVPGGVLLAHDEATGQEARLRVVATTKADVFPASERAA